jgi:RNA ligase
MKTPLFKFPSIGQFKQTITSMKKLDIQESIKFKGTVKLHGTNAGIGYSEKHGLWCQSHKRIITPDNDNYKFAQWVEDNKKEVITFMKNIADFYKVNLEENVIILYGEYCGGKIQKNVAISGLNTMLVIFDIATGTYEDCNKSFVDSDEVYLKWFNISDCKIPFPTQLSIYNIEKFDTYEIEMDINNLETARNQLIELTNAIEKECPVGKYFGRIPCKDCTTGEGIVWRCSYKLDNGYSRILRFKVKGEEHSTTKVTTMTGVNVEHINSIKSFINLSVTENRLNQGISEIFGEEEPNNTWFKKIGKFNQWVVHDVKKEDMDAFPFLDDYEGKNGEDRQKDIVKLLNKSISDKSGNWLRSYIKNI